MRDDKTAFMPVIKPPGTHFRIEFISVLGLESTRFVAPAAKLRCRPSGLAHRRSLAPSAKTRLDIIAEPARAKELTSG